MTVAPLSANWADVAKRRSSTWWLLSQLVIEQPSEPWLSELESVLQTVNTDTSQPLGPEAAALLAALRAARQQPAGLTTLAVDRTSLLAGVLHKGVLAGPYESASLGLDMNGDKVTDAAQFYLEAGMVDFCVELGPPDYLGTQLRFMSVLAYQEMLAHQAADDALAAHWLDMQQRFLEAHLLDWVPAHCDKLAQQAKTDYYHTLSNLLKAACELDLADVLEISKQTAAASQAVAAGAHA